MAIPEAIAAVSSAIGIAKRLKEISKTLENADCKNLLADLSLDLADVKLKLADFMEENVTLRAELAELKNQEAEGPPQLKGGVYFKENGDGPFCTACFDKGGKFIRIKREQEGWHEFGTHMCPVCKAYYTVEI